MLNVNPKTVKFDSPRIDVERDGEEYLTLYTTDDVPNRVIDRNKSLPGALGNATKRQRNSLGLHANRRTAASSEGPNANGHGNGNGQHRPPMAAPTRQRRTPGANATARSRQSASRRSTPA